MNRIYTQFDNCISADIIWPADLDTNCLVRPFSPSFCPVSLRKKKVTTTPQIGWTTWNVMNCTSNLLILYLNRTVFGQTFSFFFCVFFPFDKRNNFQIETASWNWHNLNFPYAFCYCSRLRQIFWTPLLI